MSTRLCVNVLSPSPTPPLGCQVLIAFGRDASADYVIDSELYDPSSNSWSLSGAVSSGRIYHAAVGLNQGGAMFAAGGALWGRVGASVCVLWARGCVCACAYVNSGWGFIVIGMLWCSSLVYRAVRQKCVCVCAACMRVCDCVHDLLSICVDVCPCVCGCAAVWQVS